MTLFLLAAINGACWIVIMTNTVGMICTSACLAILVHHLLLWTVAIDVDVRGRDAVLNNLGSRLHIISFREV